MHIGQAQINQKINNQMAKRNQVITRGDDEERLMEKIRRVNRTQLRDQNQINHNNFMYRSTKKPNKDSAVNYEPNSKNYLVYYSEPRTFKVVEETKIDDNQGKILNSISHKNLGVLNPINSYDYRDNEPM